MIQGFKRREVIGRKAIMEMLEFGNVVGINALGRRATKSAAEKGKG